MSFFSASAGPATYKPQIRQEGFHLPSPPPSVPSPSLSDPMFTHFLPDPFRKSSEAHQAHGSHLDFSDELASLIPPSPAPPHSATSHERSTHSPDEHHADQHQYRHNIFDISAPAFNHQTAATQYGNGGPQAPGAQASSPTYDYAPSAPPPHFNSTVPAIGSSLRYDDQHAHQQPTPSSYASHLDYSARDASTGPNRSRSRSRDIGASTNGGPARTQRPKRGSISSASPPRHPHAILIPPHASLSARAAAQQQAQAAAAANPVSPLSLHSLSTSTPNGWFPTHDAYGSLPTPDSLNGPAFGSYTSAGALGVSPKDSVDPSLDAAAKQAAIANEKRRRRRESHNAVERRRRDNINEKIAELATLIPESMLDPTGGAPTSPSDEVGAGLAGLVAPATPPKDEDDMSLGGKKDEKEKERDGGVKANKGMILRKSVEYIRYLQQLVAAQAQRNRELEARLSGFLPAGADAEPEMVVLGGAGVGVGSAGAGLFGERRSLERVVEEQHDLEGEDAMDVAMQKSPGADSSLSEEGSGELDLSTGPRGRTAARRVSVKEEEREAEDNMEVS